MLGLFGRKRAKSTDMLPGMGAMVTLKREGVEPTDVIVYYG